MYCMKDDIADIFISEEAIQDKVRELGAAISRDYANRPPVLVGVLRGVVIFMADLLRTIDIPVAVDFMAISRYGPTPESGGVVRLIKDLEEPIEGRHVLFVEDIVDTGLTANYLLRNLRGRQPASLEMCVLFDRPRHRLIDTDIAYVGFEIGDEFIVGYGLDYAERYRNLPYVGILKPEIYQSS
ncbi:MAG: Hypoxanthine-guanine phosphoribosyltransferase [Anaerolineales bacterium]|nr:Hypoxanthine-guanine phosphoribosyltransferase [Anaerolineales bacterium]